ncbi:MAG: O-antigen ligase family protein, partial [Phaeodactylibacter sp.]|nr:O-antigen ligase family protein [Phaeodactylibacter sp.]
MPSSTDDSIQLKDRRRLFWGFTIITLLSLFAGIIANFYVLAGVPALLLLGYLTIVDFRSIFYLLVAMLPLSTEIYLPNGFGTDLPAEPLMILMMGVFLLYAVKHVKTIEGDFYKHPISILLYIHLGWILVTAITSGDIFVSIKFLLAKFWYVCSFYFLAALILKERADFQKLFWWGFTPLLLTTFYVVIRHATYGFAFADINRVMNPFFRNHVNYACILALFFPLIWFVRFWYPKNSLIRWGLLFSAVWMLLAIQLSYTRAAYVGIVIAFGAYFIIRMKLVRVVLVLAVIGLIGV